MAAVAGTAKATFHQGYAAGLESGLRNGAPAVARAAWVQSACKSFITDCGFTDFARPRRRPATRGAQFLAAWGRSF